MDRTLRMETKFAPTAIPTYAKAQQGPVKEKLPTLSPQSRSDPLLYKPCPDRSAYSHCWRSSWRPCRVLPRTSGAWTAS
jgi:hypothetical protein